jgi:hypothetical protein
MRRGSCYLIGYVFKNSKLYLVDEVPDMISTLIVLLSDNDSATISVIIPTPFSFHMTLKSSENLFIFSCKYVSCMLTETTEHVSRKKTYLTKLHDCAQYKFDKLVFRDLEFTTAVPIF